MPLSDEELRSVLTRAAEIQYAARPDSAELEALIRGAEAAGYSRTAVERALRERYDLSATPPVPGERAFVLSSDGKYYAATILSVSPEGVRVRFLVGTERTVATDEVRPFSLAPGERVTVDWPWWGHWLCTVMAYDASKDRVKLSDRWGTSRWFPLAEVAVEPPTPGPVRSPSVAFTLVTTGLGVGAVIGSLLTAFFLR